MLTILDEHGDRSRIHTASRAAERYGISAGMPLGAAHALCPTLQGFPRDPEAETRSLKRLATWTTRFTSVVSLEPPQALLLEIGGSLRLFGGLEALQRELSAGLAARGHHVVTAVAPTALASLLLATHNHQVVLRREEALRSALGQLPIGALALDKRQHRRLTKAGIRLLRDLWRLPRDGLARRFGPALLDTLDQALGIQREARELFPMPPRFKAQRELDGEIDDTAVLLEAARGLFTRLADYLRRRDAGTTRIRLDLYHARGRSSRLEVGVRQCTRDAGHLFDLLKERLHRIRLSAPVIRIDLIADHMQAFETSPSSLFAQRDAAPPPGAEDLQWQRTLEQLQARLGAKALYRLQVIPEHRPERAWSRTATGVRDACPPAPRPLWLLPSPQALTPHRRRTLRLLTGPERIESGWWDSHDIRRDYFVAADDDGSRLWIFRDLADDGAWYLHGYFG